MGKKLLICSVIAFSVIFSACGKGDKKNAVATNAAADKVENAASSAKIKMADKDYISKPATLSNSLPASTMAYLRLPTVKNSFSPTGTTLDPAIGNEVMAKQIKAIYPALFDKIAGLTQGANKALIELLLSNAVSPLEIAILQPSNPQMPFPTAVIKLSVENESHDSIQAKIDGIAKEFPVMVNQRLTKDQNGQLSAGPFSIFLDFDVDTNSLMLIGGHMAAINKVLYQQVKASIIPNNQHPMLKLEQDIDASGKGLFAWFGVNKILPIYKNVIPPQNLAKLQTAGVDKMNSIVIGSGSSNGKAKLSIIAEMPDVGFKQYIYKPNNNYNFSTAGEPRYLLSLALPKAEQITKTEVAVSKNFPKENFEDWMNAKTKFSFATGISFDDIFKAIDSELISFGDQTGDFIALKLKDKALFKTVLEKLVSKFQLNYEVREHKGQKYHHLAIPQMNSLQEQQLQELATSEPMLMAYFQFMSTFKGKSHLYWIESGEYLIGAQIPQLLMDRLSHKQMIKVSSWLKDTQKIDPSNSLMMVSTTIDDLPNTIYKFQISLLNYLNDVATNTNKKTNNTTAKVTANETGFDIFKLPTPKELNLPKDGTYAMQFDVSETQIALNITSDFSAADILLNNNGMATVAVAGILAAVAIPAYEDYKLKAEVQESYYDLKSHTYSIEAYYMSNNKFPSAEDISKFDLRPTSKIAYSYSIAPETGIITGVFNPKMDGIDMLTLRLIPDVSQGQFMWRCESSGVQTKLIPAECR